MRKYKIIINQIYVYTVQARSEKLVGELFFPAIRNFYYEKGLPLVSLYCISTTQTNVKTVEEIIEELKIELEDK